MKAWMQEVMNNTERILKANVGTRDSDKALLLAYLFDNTKIGNLPNETLDLIAKAVYTEMPSFETITRCRRKIQERGEYLSTLGTRKGRAAKAKAMKAMMK